MVTIKFIKNNRFLREPCAKSVVEVIKKTSTAGKLSEDSIVIDFMNFALKTLSNCNILALSLLKYSN